MAHDEKERIASHLNQIPRDLREMTQKIRSMTQSIEVDIRKLNERHEYVRAEGATALGTIDELKLALNSLNEALDKLRDHF